MYTANDILNQVTHNRQEAAGGFVTIFRGKRIGGSDFDQEEAMLWPPGYIADRPNTDFDFRSYQMDDIHAILITSRGE